MTKKTTEELFAKLAKASNQLHEATDTINPLIESFEEKLDGLKARIAVWLEAPIPEVNMTLGYARVGRRWCVAVREWVEAYNEDGDDISEWSEYCLQNASREVRIHALPMLPQLLNALIEESQKTLKKITFAKSEFEKKL